MKSVKVDNCGYSSESEGLPSTFKAVGPILIAIRDKDRENEKRLRQINLSPKKMYQLYSKHRLID